MTIAESWRSCATWVVDSPIPLLRRGGSREATDGVVACVPAHAQENHPGGSAATPPKEGNSRGDSREASISFPSLGGVAVAKRLTGWSVTFLHTRKKTTPAAPPPPLLRRGICGYGDGAKRRQFPFPSLGGVAVAKRLTGWSVTFLHTLRKTTPAAPPPPLLRRGINPVDH